MLPEPVAVFVQHGHRIYVGRHVDVNLARDQPHAQGVIVGMHVVALNDEGRGVAVVVFRRQFAAEEAAFVFEVICRFRHNPIVEPIMAIFSLFWRRMCRMQRDVVYSKEVARVCSSVDRASVSGTEGRGFDPHQAHQHGFRLTAGSLLHIRRVQGWCWCRQWQGR